MDHLVNFQYEPGQTVYFIHKKGYPKKGIISEVNIKVTSWHNGECCPIIVYTISGNEYKECELFKTKEAIKLWIDNNWCHTKEIDCDKAYAWWFDEDNNIGKSVRVLSIIERTNNKHPWKKKKIAEIFYKHNNKGIFRYVLFDNIRDLYGTKNFMTETKSQLMKEYGMNYIEDGIYNFVNYDGIKF